MRQALPVKLSFLILFYFGRVDFSFRKAVMERLPTPCGKKRNSLSREDDGLPLPKNKRMQSSLVITGPDGKIKTKSGHREPAESCPVRPKFDAASIRQQLSVSKLSDATLNNRRKVGNSTTQLSTTCQPEFSTPQPFGKSGPFQVHHNHMLTPLMLTPFACESTRTPTTRRSKLRLPMSSSKKMRSRAVSKLRMLDDQEVQASRLVQARHDLLMDTQERAYVAWLNHVLDKPATGGSRISNFEDFVSRNSSGTPPSTSSPYAGFRLINEVYRDGDLFKPSPRDVTCIGRSPLQPLNGVGNRAFGSPVVANITTSRRSLKDAFTTPDKKIIVAPSAATPHLSSKRLKMITEHGISYPRDTHMQDFCRLPELVRRLKLHFGQTEREEILDTITQLAKHIDEGRLRMKKGCGMLADVALRKKALQVLLNYNAYWMRIGLHIVLGQTALLKEKLSDNNSKKTADSEAEFALFEVFLERHFLAHPGLAKKFASNKTIDGLYRDGYSEALGRVILKRFFLLVLVLDKAKCQTTMKMTDGIDGVDGGSPPLFRFDARVKSSRQALQDFLSDLMHGEGDVVGNLSALGYQVHHHQAPLADFDFAVVDLLADLRDGVRLCRLVQLLAANDTFFLEHIQVPSNGRKRQLHNCEIALESLAQAGVPLEDDDGCCISSEDIVGGNRDKVFPLLWNIMVHLQVPLLVSRPRLCQEISRLEGTEGGVALGLDIGTVELLLKWTQVTCKMSGNFNVRNFRTSFADGQALCYIINHYLPLLLLQNAVLRPSSMSDSEEQSGLQTVISPPKDAFASAYKKVVAHNFGLVQDVTRKLGGIPEVLQLVDLLGDPGISERNIIIFVSFLSSRLLKDKHLDLNSTQQGRISRDADANRQVDELLKYSSQCNLESESPSGFSRSYLVPWPQHEAICGTVEPQVYGQAEIDETSIISSEDSLLKICRIQSWWRFCVIRQRVAKRSQHRNFAALKIQSHWRGFLVRRMLRRWTAAAKVIQNQYRHQSTYKREQAAYVLQHYFRAWVRRRKHFATVRNMCKIQAFWWAHEARGNFFKERRAVRTIETEWQQYVIRNRFHIAQEEWQKCQTTHVAQAHRGGCYTQQTLTKEAAAAVLIQSYFRGHLQRTAYESQRLAAQVIQFHVRAWMQNRGDQAASWVIEEFWRRHPLQNQFVVQKEAAKTIQCAWRAFVVQRARKLCALAIEARSCTTIQAFWKGHIARRQFLVQKLAVKRLQLAWRQFASSRKRHFFAMAIEATIVIQTRRSTKIQAVWRGHVARKQFELQKKAAAEIQRVWLSEAVRKRQQAATAIQACWRSFIARQHFEVQKQAARKIQVEWLRFTALRKRKWSLIALQAAAASQARRNKIQACWQRNAAKKIQAKWRHFKACRETRLSAITIQAFWRRHIARRRLKTEKNAAKKIQREWRRFIDCKLKRNLSATAIQARWKSYVARDVYKLIRSTVLTIQRYYRGHVQRSFYETKKRAAIVIQANYRAQLQRREFQAQKRASIVIQAKHRAQLQRRIFQAQKRAAIVIQANFRAQLQRRRFQSQKRAAMEIQATYRAQMQYRIFQAQKQAAIVIQANYRAHLQSRIYQGVAKSTRKIQAWWRARACLIHFLRQKMAVRKIQKNWRDFSNRKRNAKRERNAAASFIQCHYRGHMQRKFFRSYRNAALIIQAHSRAFLDRRLRFKQLSISKVQSLWRGRKARLLYTKHRQSALKIQSRWRQYKTLERHISATKIQAAWLRFSSRRVYSRWRAAAIVLQSCYRGFVQRRVYRMCKFNACIIQAHVKGWIQKRDFHAAVGRICKLQARWRAHSARSQYLRTKIAVKNIQRAWRLHAARIHYVAVQIQATWRGFLVRQLRESRATAAIVIQKHYREHIHRRGYKRYYDAVVRCQAAWRGRLVRQKMKACQEGAIRIQAAVRGMFQRTRLREQRKAVSILQCVFRAWHAKRVSLQEEQKLRRGLRATAKLQAVWRKHCELEAQAQDRSQPRDATEVCKVSEEQVSMEVRSDTGNDNIPSHPRLEDKELLLDQEVQTDEEVTLPAMFQETSSKSPNLNTHCCETTATASVQTLPLNSDTESFEAQVLAVRVVQRCWRSYQFRKNSGLDKETRFRAVDCLSVQDSVDRQKYSLEELNAGHVIFNSLKACLERSRFVKLRRCTVVIQKYVRGWILRSIFAKKKKFAISVQAHWKGYRIRRSLSPSEHPVGELRQRMQSTAASVKDSQRLWNRLTEALSQLPNQKTVTAILSTCRTIDVATQHSSNCCAKLAEAGAIAQLLQLIQTINRSAPFEQVLKHSLSILNNLAFYPPLASKIAQAPTAIRIVSEQLHVFRNNENIFAQAISLLQIVCKTPEGVEVLQREQPVYRRLQVMAQSLERKVQVEKRNMEKLPWATAAAAVQRKSAQKKMVEAHWQFLSTVALLQDVNRLSQQQTTTVSTPAPRHLKHDYPSTAPNAKRTTHSVVPATCGAKRHSNPPAQQRPPLAKISRRTTDFRFRDSSRLF